MKTEIVKIDMDWLDVKNMCRHTSNKKSSNIPGSKEFKCKILVAEHSPIRLLRVKWHWGAIKSWITVHFARHWLGWEKWISTQRSDRTGVDRDSARQDSLVTMDIEANAQALINVSRWRLCNMASKETREYMFDIKDSLSNIEETKELANVLVPNCVYRFGCPEFKPCGYFEKFLKWCNSKEIMLTDIYSRYIAYNEFVKEEWYNTFHEIEGEGK